MYSVILCGGSGTRLWPLSRKNYPKQFLNLYSDKSILQETFIRNSEIVSKEKIFFVSNEKNFYNVFNQIKDIYPNFPKEQIITEPASKNTAPAIALAMKYLVDKKGVGKNEQIMFLPADHYIGKKAEYKKIVKKAFFNNDNNIGTIGIIPEKPETGYGYIKKGLKKNNHFQVKNFKEKPNIQDAKRYVKSGDYVWNAGMYIFNYNIFRDEIKKYAPEISKYFEKDYDKFLKCFLKLPSISVDYAISEKSDKVIVFEGDFSWSDIGSFDSLAELLSKKKDKNINHIKMNCENVFIHSSTEKLIATMDVENLIVVENNDSILIQRAGKSEKTKDLVDFLVKKKYKQINHNVIVHRPWGKYEVLIDGTRHKVRKLTIYPKAYLNFHMHRKRAEHWIVIKGMADVKRGSKKVILKNNESIFIPQFAKHQLGNSGKVNLEIIEVQTGEYLEDDDIITYH